MSPDLERLIRDLIAGINQSAASGLLGRDLIVLATRIEQQLGQERRKA